MIDINFKALLLADLFLSHAKVEEMDHYEIKTQAIFIGRCEVVYDVAIYEN
jgi:hypothetical protein